MILAFILNVVLAFNTNEVAYKILLILQVVFYVLALAGWFFESRQMRVKILFIPYYFCMMNYAVIAGINRYFFGKQSAAWEKAKRKQLI
jgi:hypothetical protein